MTTFGLMSETLGPAGYTPTHENGLGSFSLFSALAVNSS